MNAKTFQPNPILRRFIRELIMYVVITAVSAYLIGSLYATINSWEAYRISFFIATVFYVIMRLLPGLAAPWIIQKLLLERFERSFKTTVIEILIFSLSGLLGTLIVLTILSGITNMNFLGSGRVIYVQLFIGLGITLLIVASIYAVIFYREMMKKVIEAQQARELATQAELKALRAQINPHFLFNTLNSISSLIPVEPEKADRVTQKLADIFRYVLIASEKESVTLEEELRFIHNYLEIEKIRFGDRLVIQTSIQPETAALTVPSLILQPIVENALKHGISRKVGGGTLTIRSKEDQDSLIITIEDDGDGFSGNDKNTGGLGIGLSNVDQRLKKTYGEQYGINIDHQPSQGAKVTLRLPCKKP